MRCCRPRAWRWPHSARDRPPPRVTHTCHDVLHSELTIIVGSPLIIANILEVVTIQSYGDVNRTW